MIRVIVTGAYGQMGKMIVQAIVRQEDMQIVGAIGRPGHALIGTDIGEVAGVGTLGVLLNSELSMVLPQGDVVIEFTTPSATIAHLRHVAKAEKAMVIGTTGYTAEELRQVRKLATHIPCVMAPNMSIGANVLLQAIQLVASRLGNDYDVEVVEAHHHHKVDSPSGTALRMSEVLAETLDRKLEGVGVYRRHGITGVRPKEQIGIHAIRGGDIPGSHTVLFAGSGERLEIAHHAHSREAFASGTVRAARWVVNAPKGLHDIQDMLYQ
ncbi:4-hydroxy-tetrahydrodipicolinate reductase [Candidatus Poribacteria bacterium]|nr:4-hydroxy-tetrahydrodipicolinate reductase [Candidatus Poribacteria bacterium]